MKVERIIIVRIFWQWMLEMEEYRNETGTVHQIISSYRKYARLYEIDK